MEPTAWTIERRLLNKNGSDLYESHRQAYPERTNLIQNKYKFKTHSFEAIYIYDTTMTKDFVI